MGSAGKTYWTIHLTAHITKGLDWADGTPCEEGSHFVWVLPPAEECQNPETVKAL